MSAFDDFAAAPRWIAGRNERRGEKLTKIPYTAPGRKAEANDPATWIPRGDAERCAERIVNGLGGGIGIELGDLGADLHLAGLDLDSCLDSGELADWAAALIKTAPTYGEVSPSGAGIKLFFFVETGEVRSFLDRIGVEPHAWGTRRSAPGADGRDHGPAVELYCAGRYFAVTERHWAGTPTEVRLLDRDQLDRLAPLIPPPRTARSNGSGASGNTGDNSRSAIAFRKGAALRRAGKTFEEMCAALRTDAETSAWCREKGEAAGARELRRIWDKADVSTGEGVGLDDFYAYMPTHQYLFVPDRSFWPAGSVDARIPPVHVGTDEDDKPKKIKASLWLDQNRPVEQMTWAPGLPRIIADRLMDEGGGWIDRVGVSCFNHYLPPTIERGDASRAEPWIDHVRFLYSDEADHIFDWLAHRVQRPEEKVNHALVLLGDQGIGKDTMLQPLVRAVGPANFREATPSQILGRFNSFVKGVILRVNEAHDTGDFDRFALYERLKVYTAAPPDTLRVDEKHIREYQVLNVCGVIITSNHESGAIFLPPGDRRHFVCFTRVKKEHERFQNGYWNTLHRWFDEGGFGHVAAFLRERDLGNFDPKAPPRQTEAFLNIVNSERSTEEAELADIIDAMGKPKALTLDAIIARAGTLGTADFEAWLRDRRNRRVIPHRLAAIGYVPVRNPDSDQGLWRVGIPSKRQAIYAQTTLSPRDQIEAARGLR